VDEGVTCGGQVRAADEIGVEVYVDLHPLISMDVTPPVTTNYDPGIRPDLVQ